MRVTTTIDDDLVAEVRSIAEQHNESLSAFVSEAVRLRLEQLKKQAAFEALKGLIRPDYAKASYVESLRQLRNE